LLGVLGSGARNPHGILELGSRIGSVPSWLGGKIQFWAEFGQSLGRAELGQTEWETTSLERYLCSLLLHVIIVMMVHYFTMLYMFFFYI
jgi:hypothetical protein